MIETNLQEAIAKISMDEDYRKKLIDNPDQFLKDYGIKTQETLPNQDGQVSMISDSIRPTAICCSCYPA